jgi:hypothetical protein
MSRRVPQFVLFSLAICALFTGSPAKAQAQSFTGKWVYPGPKGISVLEFFPGESRMVGPVRGHFHHSIILDDGRLIEGEGSYVYRSVLPKRGWLVLTFADGHVTREHEHTVDAQMLRIEHHGITRMYVRERTDQPTSHVSGVVYIQGR